MLRFAESWSYGYKYGMGLVSCSDLDGIGFPVVWMWGVVESHVLSSY